MKPINASIYDFPTMITGGYAYVDKTAELYELAKPGTDILYYLPRPRRFGKLLTISTLKALFQGRRELFRGGKIEKTDWEHEVYPVLYLDMSNVASRNAAELEISLQDLVQGFAGTFDAPITRQLDNVKTEIARPQRETWSTCGSMRSQIGFEVG